ncbi:MAG TPA: PKD domain-containing protein, partial [Thermoanaerobaculia bacterium]|nr:PKD domain-containing protein [Thermoanaerobaculia bacterium]
ETSLNVDRVLKGRADATITIAEIGGTLDDRITKVFGAPEYHEGEHVLVFLERTARGEYRTIDLFVGKFNEERMADGRRLWFRDEASPHVTLLDAGFQPIDAVNVQRDASRFESFVSERIAGRAGQRNYGIENPVIEGRLRDAFRQTDDFTLISEPSVYRWSSFDSGQTASWYSSGTQPGYTGGGTSEISTAMSSWTSYSSAKILYAFAGSTSLTPGGLSANNGRNEIMLNDPLSEISGTWNRSTGGVVGQGGFSGVSFGGNWTATFTADASHPAGTVRSIAITEGNLVIQDGVSPSTGISSVRLAEIIAHELGHTLGFGHSADSTALMYFSVTGLGPALRDDDRLAARWLYPNGSSTPAPPPPPPPPVPNAPSNLIAAASGSGVTLQWSDNATNETGQSVYYALGNSGFIKVGDVSANATSTSLNGFAAGSYRFYVVAFNSSGQSSPSNTATATIGGTAAASFSMTPQSGTANATTFTFYDESTGTIASRLWNFGDGTTSNALVAAHIYAAAGIYTVTLTVTGTSGNQSQASRTVNVNGPLAAAFAYSPSNPTTNDTITFLDQTTGGVTSWSWSFGDGSTSSAQNPSKRYASPGTYTVALTAIRNAESSYVTKSVTVGSPLP